MCESQASTRLILPPKDSGLKWSGLAHRFAVGVLTEEVWGTTFVYVGAPEDGDNVKWTNTFHLRVDAGACEKRSSPWSFAPPAADPNLNVRELGSCCRGRASKE